MNPQSDFFFLSLSLLIKKKKSPRQTRWVLVPPQHPLPTLQAPLINLSAIKKLPFLKWVFYLVTCVEPRSLCGPECGSEGHRTKKWSLLVQAGLVLALLFIQNFPSPVAPLAPGLLTITVAPPISSQIWKLRLSSCSPKIKSLPWWGQKI